MLVYFLKILINKKKKNFTKVVKTRTNLNLALVAFTSCDLWLRVGVYKLVRFSHSFAKKLTVA